MPVLELEIASLYYTSTGITFGSVLDGLVTIRHYFWFIFCQNKWWTWTHEVHWSYHGLVRNSPFYTGRKGSTEDGVSVSGDYNTLWNWMFSHSELHWTEALNLQQRRHYLSLTRWHGFKAAAMCFPKEARVFLQQSTWVLVARTVGRMTTTTQDSFASSCLLSLWFKTLLV